MTLSLALTLRLHFLYRLFAFSYSFTLIYHTENSPSIQYYDCIHSRDFAKLPIKYCRQFDESQSLQRHFDQSCYNGGQLLSFKTLSDQQISSTDVLQWSSSVEQADLYAKYLSNHFLNIEDQFICNCTNPNSFGKFCEYQYYDDNITNFDDAMLQRSIRLQDFHLKNGKVHPGSQLHSNRPCYVTLECDSGLICLDWRHICDGNDMIERSFILNDIFR